MIHHTKIKKFVAALLPQPSPKDNHLLLSATIGATGSNATLPVACLVTPQRTIFIHTLRSHPATAV